MVDPDDLNRRFRRIAGLDETPSQDRIETEQNKAQEKPAPQPEHRLRDVDNAKPDLRPRYANPGLYEAPPGALGIKRDLPSNQNFKPLAPNNEQAKKLANTALEWKTNPNSDWVTQGRINGHPDYQFKAQINNAPSKDGIDQGCVTKLALYKHNRMVAGYDRGWVHAPRTQEDKDIIKTITQGFEKHMERENPSKKQEQGKPAFKPLAPPRFHKNHDIER
jgi:hypothetical protein